MKKALSFLFLVVLFTSCTNVGKPKADYDISLNDLTTSDNLFGWPGAIYGSSVTETEKALNITFPEIPFFSEEWLDSEAKVFRDYRNITDYDFVEFAAYKGGKPVLVKYGDSYGNMTCEFNKGKLSVVMVYFTNGAMPRDKKLNSGNYDNNLEKLYSQLLDDSKSIWGEPDYIIDQPDYPLESRWDKKDTRYYATYDTRGETDYVRIAIQQINS